jgi:SAM-dependent methyltransferase
MAVAGQKRVKRRYEGVAGRKAGGATYTPPALADFVAGKIVASARLEGMETIHILDPAVGDGALVLSLLGRLPAAGPAVVVTGFDTDPVALALARQRIARAFPRAQLQLEHGSFLDVVLAPTAGAPPDFDLVIANPPYVRTQIIGSDQARALARLFGLKGRVDLYHAFLMGIGRVLRPGGVAGLIVSNRFMTTKGGASVRAALRRDLTLQHIWDFGDTRLFEAAVLPAVLLAHGGAQSNAPDPGFTTIYQTQRLAGATATDPIAAVEHEGVVAIADGRRFEVRRGTLGRSSADHEVWRLTAPSVDGWLATVAEHAWGVFGDIGKIRVGVKTCADEVFIRTDWDAFALDQRPELLRPLITHHTAGRFRPTVVQESRAILYPHETVNGRRQVVDLALYPKARAYLEQHRQTLEARSYLIRAGRQWCELWVPQDPAAWAAPKLVFRDISERPTFWVDLEGRVVNGDCYWLAARDPRETDLLWLAAAVANSSFVELFYDRRFNNKLYAGRRRFITQYVEQFPLPDPASDIARQLIEGAKVLHGLADPMEAHGLEASLDAMVWRAFGLPVEGVAG